MFFCKCLVKIQLLTEIISTDTISPRCINIAIRKIISSLATPTCISSKCIYFITYSIAFLILQLACLIFPYFILERSSVSQPVCEFKIKSRKSTITKILTLRQVSSQFVQRGNIHTIQSVRRNNFLLWLTVPVRSRVSIVASIAIQQRTIRNIIISGWGQIITLRCTISIIQIRSQIQTQPWSKPGSILQIQSETLAVSIFIFFPVIPVRQRSIKCIFFRSTPDIQVILLRKRISFTIFLHIIIITESLWSQFM